MAEIKGGDKAMSVLADIGRSLSPTGSTMFVKVGFMDGATYPDGTSVAEVAAIQEFGASIERGPSEQTIYRQTNEAGTDFLKGGRFVKASKSNFASTHAVDAYTINIPPRPFFRNMIAENSGEWAGQLAKMLRANDENASRSLKQMGELIKGQLFESIKNTNDPPLARSTVRAKGFDKPLIDTGHMSNSIDYVVEE